jgi:hypothetical protein
MTVALPTSPGPVASDIEFMDFGGPLESMMGGVTQQVIRLGSRFRLKFPLPPMTPQQGREWFAKLGQARLDGTARIAIRQPGLMIGVPGGFVVNGAGQTGMTLNVRGGAAGYAFQTAQLLSITVGTRSYLYPLASAVAANGSGGAALPLLVPLRASPADGAVIELLNPVIEGALENVANLPIDAARLSGRFEVVIVERK